MSGEPRTKGTNMTYNTAHDETAPCGYGTPGCAVDHAVSGRDSECEVW